MFVLMAIVGALVYLSLSIIGIKFAFLLGVLSGLFELVPVVGPILAAVPAIILGLLQSPATGLMVLLVYIVVQQIENHVFVPLIMQKTIGLNPIVIIIALLVGWNLGGVLGLLVAVPAATAVGAEVIARWGDWAQHRSGNKLASRTLRLWFEGALAPSAAKWTILPELAAVQCPVSILQGELDGIVDEEHAYGLARALGGPSQVRILPNGAHLCQRSHPDEWNAWLEESLLHPPAGRAES
jgi:pimeloyl-ACP methyl ester carboxylesterase